MEAYPTHKSDLLRESSNLQDLILPLITKDQDELIIRFALELAKSLVVTKEIVFLSNLIKRKLHHLGRCEIKESEIDRFLEEINKKMGKKQYCFERCKTQVEKFFSNSRNIYEAYKLES